MHKEKKILLLDEKIISINITNINNIKKDNNKTKKNNLPIKEKPKDIPKIVKKPKITPKEKPKDIPKIVEKPKIIPKEKPKDIPKIVKKPKIIPKEKPKDIPKIVEKPKITPKEKSKDIPKIVEKPKITPKEKPKDIPKIVEKPKIISKEKHKDIPKIVEKPKIIPKEEITEVKQDTTQDLSNDINEMFDNVDSLINNLEKDKNYSDVIDLDQLQLIKNKIQFEIEESRIILSGANNARHIEIVMLIQVDTKCNIIFSKIIKSSFTDKATIKDKNAILSAQRMAYQAVQKTKRFNSLTDIECKFIYQQNGIEAHFFANQ